MIKRPKFADPNGFFLMLIRHWRLTVLGVITGHMIKVGIIVNGKWLESSLLDLSL